MEIGNITTRLGDDLKLWQKLLLDIEYAMNTPVIQEVGVVYIIIACYDETSLTVLLSVHTACVW